MTYSFIDNEIDENDCIGDSLPLINRNYVLLDNGLSELSAQHTLLKTQYNTLIQSITSIGSLETDYTSLSTAFLSLSSLIVS
jgi:hypothetical protein